MESLKSACENHLSSSLSIDTVANALLVADMHGAASLKADCINYILANSFSVMSTDAWINMAQVRPELMREIGNISKKLSEEASKKGDGEASTKKT